MSLKKKASDVLRGWAKFVVGLFGAVIVVATVASFSGMMYEAFFVVLDPFTTVELPKKLSPRGALLGSVLFPIVVPAILILVLLSILVL